MRPLPHSINRVRRTLDTNIQLEIGTISDLFRRRTPLICRQSYSSSCNKHAYEMFKSFEWMRWMKPSTMSETKDWMKWLQKEKFVQHEMYGCVGERRKSVLFEIVKCKWQTQAPFGDANHVDGLVHLTNFLVLVVVAVLFECAGMRMLCFRAIRRTVFSFLSTLRSYTSTLFRLEFH